MTGSVGPVILNFDSTRPSHYLSLLFSGVFLQRSEQFLCSISIGFVISPIGTSCPTPKSVSTAIVI